MDTISIVSVRYLIRVSSGDVGDGGRNAYDISGILCVTGCIENSVSIFLQHIEKLHAISIFDTRYIGTFDTIQLSVLLMLNPGIISYDRMNNYLRELVLICYDMIERGRFCLTYVRTVFERACVHVCLYDVCCFLFLTFLLSSHVSSEIFSSSCLKLRKFLESAAPL